MENEPKAAPASVFEGHVPPALIRPAWAKGLDSREWSQVLHAQAYARNHQGAGAPGHGQFLLIAKLAAMLDAREPHESGGGITAALAPTTSINDAMSAIRDIAELVGWPCFDSDQADDNFSMQFKRGGL